MFKSLCFTCGQYVKIVTNIHMFKHTKMCMLHMQIPTNPNEMALDDRSINSSPALYVVGDYGDLLALP